MDIEERIIFFQKLVSCNYPIYLWSYNSDLTLLHTDCPKELLSGDMVALMNFSELLHSHIQSKFRNPLILDTDFGLLWIAAFGYEEDSLHRIYCLGPVSTEKSSHVYLKKKLDSYDISVQLRSIIFAQIESVPTIPPTMLMQYAVMFHYAVTGEEIASYQINFSANEISNPSDAPTISEEHQSIWIDEQELLNAICEGNPDYLLSLEKIISLSSGIKYEIDEPLRGQKNNLLVLLTLCSRASMQGGLNPSTAYTLNDYYANLIEQCRTIADLTNLARKILGDYMSKVREAKGTEHISSPILSACHYITVHVRESISIAELAKRAGYTEYYFSHKFKEEVGCSINEYIRNKKVETARLLLSGTNMSIQEISNELSFANRSHFYSCFQKATGLSPSEYREKNYKL